MSTTHLDLPSINSEDRVVLAYADLIARRHQELAVECGITTANFLIHHNDLAGLTADQKTMLEQQVKLLRVLEYETTSDTGNPYSAFCLVQRLFYLNKDCLAAIALLREKKSIGIETEAEMALKVKELRANLVLNYKTIEAEIVDLNKRRLALRELQAAFEHRGLIKVIKIGQAEGLAECLEFIDNSAKNLNRLTKVFLDLFHAGSETIESDSSLVMGILSFASMLAALFSCKPLQMGVFEKASFGLSMLSRAMLITKDSLEVSKAVVPTLAASLNWVPIFGIAASLISVSVAVGNIIKTNNDYKKDLELLEQEFNTHTDWLPADSTLSPDAIKLKKVLLENMSIKIACSNPRAIKSLFTQEEFNKLVKPVLLAHAKQQRNRKIANNVIVISVLLAVVALSITVLCIPVLGQAIGIALAVFLLTAFVARVVLNKTVLKTADTTKITGLPAMIDTCGKIASIVANPPQAKSAVHANYVPPSAEIKKTSSTSSTSSSSSVSSAGTNVLLDFTVPKK